MSIAASVIVRPSRIHRLLLLGWGLALAAAALAVAVGTPARFPAAPGLALLLAVTGAIVAGGAARHPKTHRIDISGTGALRVTVQQDVGTAAMPAALAVAALTGSVAWPVLALLRCQVPGAPVLVLPVWRDSVDPAGWRALMVALAVIGRRGGGEEFDKIR